jgi:hypothetical protein
MPSIGSTRSGSGAWLVVMIGGVVIADASPSRADPLVASEQAQQAALMAQQALIDTDAMLDAAKFRRAQRADALSHRAGGSSVLGTRSRAVIKYASASFMDFARRQQRARSQTSSFNRALVWRRAPVSRVPLVKRETFAPGHPAIAWRDAYYAPIQLLRAGPRTTTTHHLHR